MKKTVNHILAAGLLALLSLASTPMSSSKETTCRE